ncbi:MAG TPA: alpha/beta fold hydrolase [Terriglobia bacterium]|nr:alpha/beta fold hydrolase [Terriglobia bacterium]
MPVSERRAGSLTKRLITYAAVAIVLAAARGWITAAALGGRYPLRDLVFDGPAFASVVVALVLFDTALRSGLRRLFAAGRWPNRVARHGIYALVLPTAVFPLLLATLQLHPQRVITTQTPRDWGVDYQDVSFVSAGLRLAAWYIPARGRQRPIVLVAHGLNADKGNFLPAAIVAHDLGYDVLSLDFRAHGESDGRTTTLGFNEADDVKAAYDWIRTNKPDRPVFAMGYSMGGAAVITAAAKYGIFDRIVIDSSFTSVESVARMGMLRPIGPLGSVVWDLARFWGWVWTGVDLDRRRPVDVVGSLRNRPLLFIHGTADRLISYTESVRLRDAAGITAQLWLVDGADHVESVNRGEYKEKVGRFFSAL